MTQLGNGLHSARHYEDALTVREADLALARRFGETRNIIAALSNLASAYQFLGRRSEALSMRQDVYSVTLQLFGEEHNRTIIAANNLAKYLALSTKAASERSQSHWYAKRSPWRGASRSE